MQEAATTFWVQSWLLGFSCAQRHIPRMGHDRQNCECRRSPFPSPVLKSHCTVGRFHTGTARRPQRRKQRNTVTVLPAPELGGSVTVRLFAISGTRRNNEHSAFLLRSPLQEIHGVCDASCGPVLVAKASQCFNPFILRSCSPESTFAQPDLLPREQTCEAWWPAA